jgi:hypothetical protein
MALVASFLFWNTVRQISSDLIVLKTVSTIALKLLYSSSCNLDIFGHAKVLEDCPDDVAF